MIDDAVANMLAETDDLDFKSALPGTSGLNNTDFPKDIAAMANSGGASSSTESPSRTRRLTRGSMIGWHSAEVLDRIYQEMAVVTEVEARAWLIAVGRPIAARTGPAATMANETPEGVVSCRDSPLLPHEWRS
jgi:hypothetical protein